MGTVSFSNEDCYHLVLQVFLLSLCLIPLTTRSSPSPLFNLILGGEKEESEKQIEEVFGGPPCTVPEVIAQKVECKASLENHCNNVYEDYCITEQVGEECKKEVRKDCKKIYTTECVTEWVRECEQEENVEEAEGKMPAEPQAAVQIHPTRRMPGDPQDCMQACGAAGLHQDPGEGGLQGDPQSGVQASCAEVCRGALYWEG